MANLGIVFLAETPPDDGTSSGYRRFDIVSIVVDPKDFNGTIRTTPNPTGIKAVIYVTNVPDNAVTKILNYINDVQNDNEGEAVAYGRIRPSELPVAKRNELIARRWTVVNWNPAQFKKVVRRKQNIQNPSDSGDDPVEVDV